MAPARRAGPAHRPGGAVGGRPRRGGPGRRRRSSGCRRARGATTGEAARGPAPRATLRGGLRVPLPLERARPVRDVRRRDGRPDAPTRPGTPAPSTGVRTTTSAERAVCANGVEIRQDRLETALPRRAGGRTRRPDDRGRGPRRPHALRQDDAGRGDRQAMLIRERSLVEARVRHLLEAVKRGQADERAPPGVGGRGRPQDALATELAHLADQARVTTLDAAQMSRTLTALAADVRAVLTGAPEQARQMLRKLFAGHRSRACRSWTRRHPGLRLRGGGHVCGAAGRPAGMQQRRWCPRRDSNPCCQIENLES